MALTKAIGVTATPCDKGVTGGVAVWDVGRVVKVSVSMPISGVICNLLGPRKPGVSFMLSGDTMAHHPAHAFEL
jgi:hypothetical protein